jgi:hypothetical protein
MLENEVLQGILGPNREEVTGGEGKLQDKELQKLHYSQNIIRIVKSRRMRWVGHVSRMGI